MNKYVLTFNKKQLEIMNQAMHSYMRLMIGQINYAIEDLYWKYKDKLNNHQIELLDLIENNKEINQMFGHTEESDIAYDIHQVLRHQIWEEQPDRNESIVSAFVSQLSKESLPKILAIEEDYEITNRKRRTRMTKEEYINKFDEEPESTVTSDKHKQKALHIANVSKRFIIEVFLNDRRLEYRESTDLRDIEKELKELKRTYKNNNNCVFYIGELNIC